MTHSNQSQDETAACQQKVIDKLKININLVFEKIDELPSEKGKRQRQLSQLDKRIICRFLLGYTRAEIITKEGNHNRDIIIDALTMLIYPKLSRLLQVPKDKITGNWTRILNYLLYSCNGFRLEPPPIPNINTLMSFGNHILIARNISNVSKFMQAGAQAYSQGSYFRAFENFFTAWNLDKGNPELLIYINNCLIAQYKSIYDHYQIKIYTIAVVVPIHHNLGKIATELLYGIAQMQLQINLKIWDNLKDKDIKKYCLRLRQQLGINSNNYSESVNNNSILLQILIINENNDIIAPEIPFNQAATHLAQVSEQLEIMAVIGHYSSEMTKQALRVYDELNLLLVCPSSTSDELSNSLGMNSLLRMTTPDRIASQRLGSYLLSRYKSELSTANVTILYNKNSSYCNSFKNGLYNFFAQNNQQLYLLPECGELSEDYWRCLSHLESIQAQGLNTIIIIQDGGIEPNTINNTGMITRLKMNNCLIVGSATFYQDNVLLWAEENIRQGLLDKNNASNLVACVPWHWRSLENGDDSNNKVAADFCQLGAILWGQEKLSWRSATAYDAVLILVKAFQRYTPQDHRDLHQKMNQYFRYDGGFENGVTGKIEFERNGDRLNPPTEMVAVNLNNKTGLCEWVASC